MSVKEEKSIENKVNNNNNNHKNKNDSNKKKDIGNKEESDEFYMRQRGRIRRRNRKAKLAKKEVMTIHSHSRKISSHYSQIENKINTQQLNVPKKTVHAVSQQCQSWAWVGWLLIGVVAVGAGAWWLLL